MITKDGDWRKNQESCQDINGGGGNQAKIYDVHS